MIIIFGIKFKLMLISFSVLVPVLERVYFFSELEEVSSVWTLYLFLNLGRKGVEKGRYLCFHLKPAM